MADLNSILLPLIIFLIILLIAVIGGWFMYRSATKGKGEMERKWTDPKFHD